MKNRYCFKKDQLDLPNEEDKDKCFIFNVSLTHITNDSITIKGEQVKEGITFICSVSKNEKEEQKIEFSAPKNLKNWAEKSILKSQISLIDIPEKFSNSSELRNFIQKNIFDCTFSYTSDPIFSSGVLVITSVLPQNVQIPFFFNSQQHNYLKNLLWEYDEKKRNSLFLSFARKQVFSVFLEHFPLWKENYLKIKNKFDSFLNNCCKYFDPLIPHLEDNKNFALNSEKVCPNKKWKKIVFAIKESGEKSAQNYLRNVDIETLKEWMLFEKKK